MAREIVHTTILALIRKGTTLIKCNQNTTLFLTFVLVHKIISTYIKY